MKIYIPSRGRPDKQKTLSHIPKRLWNRVTVVVPSEEVKSYICYPGPHVIGCPESGIVQTRDFILQNSKLEDKIVMLDDDIIFQRRRPDGKITDCTDNEVVQAFQWLEHQLDDVAHAGFGTRFLSYNAEGDYISPGRMMYVLGYNISCLSAINASFGSGLQQYSTMEDFNITLQLLTRGYPNRISLEWRCSPGQSNAPGGCSTWRTAMRQTNSAELLARMYPGLVKLRPKKNWKGMDDSPMWDVTVQWKKALKKYWEGR